MYTSSGNIFIRQIAMPIDVDRSHIMHLPLESNDERALIEVQPLRVVVAVSELLRALSLRVPAPRGGAWGPLEHWARETGTRARKEEVRWR